MTAADRLSALDGLSAEDLCVRTTDALTRFAEIMNQETTLLRAGRFAEAAPLSNSKAQLAQDYVTLARAVQRKGEQLKADAPEHVEMLRAGHERLATQMAENLRVLATAKSVTEDILTDVAVRTGNAGRPQVYGATGSMGTPNSGATSGIAINRSL